MNDGDVDVLARLKGPALAIFLAIGRGRGGGQSELSAVTGWARGTTYDALRKLGDTGWIVCDQRGCWELTGEGWAAWRRLTGREEPGAGSCAPANGCPPSGTATHSPVGDSPPSITAIHSPACTSPASGTAIHSPVGDSLPSSTAIHSLANGSPPSGTVIHSATAGALPGDITNCHNIFPAAPKNGTKSAQTVPISNWPPHWPPPYDHDHNHKYLHDHDRPPPEDSDAALIPILKRLGFSDAERWLSKVDRQLIMPWLRDLAARPRENPGGYLRRCVEKGRLPSQPRGTITVRAPCPVCARTYFDNRGNCLVCDGTISV